MIMSATCVKPKHMHVKGNKQIAVFFFQHFAGKCHLERATVGGG